VAGPSAANWSAALSSCFGATVSQSGTSVTGAYTLSPLTGAAVIGTLTGTISGTVLSGTVSEPPNGGTFQVTFSGNSYTGQFAFAGGGGGCQGTVAGP